MASCEIWGSRRWQGPNHLVQINWRPLKDQVTVVLIPTFNMLVFSVCFNRERQWLSFTYRRHSSHVLETLGVTDGIVIPSNRSNFPVPFVVTFGHLHLIVLWWWPELLWQISHEWSVGQNNQVLFFQPNMGSVFGLQRGGFPGDELNVGSAYSATLSPSLTTEAMCLWSARGNRDEEEGTLSVWCEFLYRHTTFVGSSLTVPMFRCKGVVVG